MPSMLPVFAVTINVPATSTASIGVIPSDLYNFPIVMFNGLGSSGSPTAFNVTVVSTTSPLNDG